MNQHFMFHECVVFQSDTTVPIYFLLFKQKKVKLAQLHKKRCCF